MPGSINHHSAHGPRLWLACVLTSLIHSSPSSPARKARSLLSIHRAPHTAKMVFTLGALPYDYAALEV
jgi:hypothetical protein